MKLNGKEINEATLEIENVGAMDGEEYEDGSELEKSTPIYQVQFAEYIDGTKLTDDELADLNEQETNRIFEIGEKRDKKRF